MCTQVLLNNTSIQEGSCVVSRCVKYCFSDRNQSCLHNGPRARHVGRKKGRFHIPRCGCQDFSGKSSRLCDVFWVVVELLPAASSSAGAATASFGRSFFIVSVDAQPNQPAKLRPDVTPLKLIDSPCSVNAVVLSYRRSIRIPFVWLSPKLVHTLLAVNSCLCAPWDAKSGIW